ncbi:hypothetical protein P3T76_001725 [Phytophthora citrophthora]|uniref:Uncharacterized protein n=1 Tax=Phytophthora citrophthora TaxID=4793 RepID=A0AAD9GWQ0_9STRA|nr:hypothetical protein P3T76_001725 [Phytophthora citrophthora]
MSEEANTSPGASALARATTGDATGTGTATTAVSTAQGGGGSSSATAHMPGSETHQVDGYAATTTLDLLRVRAAWTPLHRDLPRVIQALYYLKIPLGSSDSCLWGTAAVVYK